MVNLRERCRQPEIMDQPELPAEAFVGALRALERINWFSGSAGILWPAIKRLATRVGSRPLRLLDIATGGGDVPLRLARRARAAGLDLRVEGCDRNPHAVAHATDMAKAHRIPARFFEWDALTESLPGEYDIVASSLFLHHLERADALRLLANMAQAARHLVLANDLVRSTTGYLLAYVGTRLLSRSRVAHVDGPRSVESAFTLREARELALQAGLREAIVERRWPCRYLLSWSKHRSAAESTSALGDISAFQSG